MLQAMASLKEEYTYSVAHLDSCPSLAPHVIPYSKIVDI